MGDLIHIRIDANMRKEIQNVLQEGLFSSTTEFIKDAIRKSIEEYKMKKALIVVGDHGHALIARDNVLTQQKHWYMG